MAPRLQLHQLLKTFTNNVYFQPPINVVLQYPCIVYQRDFADTKFADDKPYSFMSRYMITVIDRDPDSDIVAKVASLPRSLFNRFYTADNLNHDVFSVYY
jgi:hypothetical protein